MFTGLYEQTVTEPKHVKKIEVEVEIGDLFESCQNPRKFQHLLLVFVRNAAARPAPSREFEGRVGRSVNGSPPGLARQGG